MRHGDKCCVAVATGGKDSSSEMRVKTIDLCVCVEYFVHGAFSCANQKQGELSVNPVFNVKSTVYLCCALNWKRTELKLQFG